MYDHTLEVEVSSMMWARWLATMRGDTWFIGCIPPIAKFSNLGPDWKHLLFYVLDLEIMYDHTLEVEVSSMMWARWLATMRGDTWFIGCIPPIAKFSNLGPDWKHLLFYVLDLEIMYDHTLEVEVSSMMWARCLRDRWLDYPLGCIPACR